jgi:antitoxin component of MazEF toxin-antitoxin module
MDIRLVFSSSRGMPISKGPLQDAVEVTREELQAEGGQMVIESVRRMDLCDRRATVRAKAQRNATRKAAAFAHKKE